jgi:hypothetical protein
MSRYISDSLRQQVITRANEHCEYCRADIRIIIAHHIDHILPLSDGGQTISENLCLACVLCNETKNNATSGVDPQTQENVRLYHPRQDDWHSHFEWSDDGLFLQGNTPIGRATIQQLQLNRATYVKARYYWKLSGWKP